MKSVTKKDYLRYVSYLTEKSLAEMKKNSKIAEKIVTQQTVILDFDGLSMRQMFYKPFREISVEATKATEANYPETLRKSFVINGIISTFKGQSSPGILVNACSYISPKNLHDYLWNCETILSQRDAR